jgi:ribonuclease HI
MPGEYQQLFKEFRADNSECTFVYTDGSKSNTSCGCAVVSPYHGVLKAKLHPYCSVFTAELTAIRIALRSIKNSIGSFMICTDSYSALQSISVYSPGHPIVQDIQSTLLSLSKKGTTIRFAWIPGHVGITGNEKADAAAKDALRSPDTEVPLLPAEDLGNAMRNILRQNWKTQWLEIENNKLREIKADITAWQTSVRNVRREEVVLARLRIGHCVLTHSYLFTEEKTQP